MSKDECDMAFCYVILNQNGVPGDEQIPDSPAWYNDPLMTVFHLKYWHKIEEIIGVKLIPTYNYLRDYKNGSTLSKHTDRPSCEFSATINLGSDADNYWPIHIKDLDGRTHTVILKQGDAVLYKGMELEHWRNKFEGKKCTQVFLHYVDQFGPHKEWAWDKRKEQSLSFC